jgi:hypothetical protein
LVNNRGQKEVEEQEKSIWIKERRNKGKFEK